MWEIEDLTECAVRVVAAELKDAAKRREHIGALYDLHDMFDCSYTQLRIADLLIDAGFLHSIPLMEHPAAREQGDALRAAVERSGGRSAWLKMDPADPQSETAGIWCAYPRGAEPRLWFDVRGALAAELAADATDVVHGYIGFALYVLPFTRPPVAPDAPALAAVLRARAVRERLFQTQPSSWIQERFPLSFNEDAERDGAPVDYARAWQTMLRESSP